MAGSPAAPLSNRLLRDGILHPGEVLDIADALAATVMALHVAAPAHCNINPENILFIGVREESPANDTRKGFSRGFSVIGRDSGPEKKNKKSETSVLIKSTEAQYISKVLCLPHCLGRH